MPEPAFTPARRGDLAVLVTEHHEYEIRDGHYRPLEYTTAELYTVTNITRDRRVKAVRHVRYTDGPALPLDPYLRRATIYLVLADRIDVAAAINAAREHRWPHGDTYGPGSGDFMPFASLAEISEALRPYDKQPAAAAS
jgi:hypothetical protein